MIYSKPKTRPSQFFALLMLGVLSIFFVRDAIAQDHSGPGAALRLAEVFGDHMVLQRDIAIPLWGTAKPDAKVTVSLGELNTSATMADANGHWMVHLAKMQAGGPHQLWVESDSDTGKIVLKDVLIGDVWFAGGQSNMEWQVQQSKNAIKEISSANHPNIRFFNVPHAKTLKPQNDIAESSWQVCDPTSVKTTSAVAYFFSRELQADLDVPIGILQSTWGGTPVEAWTSREMMLSSSITRQRVLQMDTVTEQHFVKDSVDLVRFWDIVYNPKNKTDKKVPDRKFDDTKWPELVMPKTFKDWDMPFYEGMVWMRKTISIPENMLGKDLTIHLGHPEMNYSLYFNGEEICKTIWNANKTHYYTLPAKLVRKGENVIAVRLAVLWGGGGFNPPAEGMFVTDGNTRIGLAGPWKYMKDLEPKIPKLAHYHKFPTYLYNGMIHPVIPYGIKGIIWYQGENNAENAKEYQTLFPMLITDWRVRWQQGYLPFLYVQLANYMKTQPEPSESQWAELREAQTMTLTQPNTGMACIIDIGEADDIHPKNKQEVGHRLALLAKKQVYGMKNVVASGPVYKSHQIMGNEVRIQFDGIGSGLVSRGKELKGFALSGPDGKFFWAQARIEGEEVVISADQVKSPKAVRYAWADNPECSLMNKEGLPAVPFRTDLESQENSR